MLIRFIEQNVVSERKQYVALGKKKKVLSLNQICWYHNIQQETLLVPSAVLPETNSNRVFAISSTPLDFEREVR